MVGFKVVGFKVVGFKRAPQAALAPLSCKDLVKKVLVKRGIDRSLL